MSRAEIPTNCPECNNRLYHKKDGYVCKNWKCKRYWKMGRGPVWRGQDKAWMIRVWVRFKQEEEKKFLTKRG